MPAHQILRLTKTGNYRISVFIKDVFTKLVFIGFVYLFEIEKEYSLPFRVI